MIKTKHILYGLLSLVVLAAVFAVIWNFAEEILKEELEAPVEPGVEEEVAEPQPSPEAVPAESKLGQDQMAGPLVETLDPVYIKLYGQRSDYTYIRLRGKLVSDGGAMTSVGFRYGPSGTEVYKTQWLGARRAGETFEYHLTLPRGSWSWFAIAKHTALPYTKENIVQSRGRDFTIPPE